MKVAVVVLAASLAAAARPSEACVPIANQPFAIDDTQTADTTPPTPITVCDWFVTAQPEGDAASCGGTGYFHLFPDSTDDVTPAAELGYVFHDVGEPAPGPVALQDGALLLRFDATQDVVGRVVRIAPVDRNGNQGKAMRCTLDWTTPEPDGGGCASSRGGGWLAIGWVLLALRLVVRSRA